jgi:fumarylacetoacetase
MGTGNELGSSLAVDDAGRSIFGLMLMNDWSARDIQKWEMLPLGPFNSKNWVGGRGA